MKYVDIKGTQEVMSIEILPPKLCPFFEYYYPDGKTFGVFRKKTYFVSGLYGKYVTPQEAIQGRDDLFVKEDGRIWMIGKIKTTLRSHPDQESMMIYKNSTEVLEYLGNLEFRWGVDLGSFVCLETPKTETLYEHKIIGVNVFEE